MFTSVRSYRPGHATVVAYLALFLALGGSSYAAVTLKKNSVKSRQLAPNSVRASETAKNSVGSPEVIDGSLLRQDFKAGQLPAGAPGAQGVPGAPGTAGGQGAPGQAGAAGTARAFARVNAAGVVSAESPNRTGGNVVKVGTGLYCFTFSDISSSTPNTVYLVSIDQANALATDNALIRSNGAGCAAGQFAVLTTDVAGTAKDAGFAFMVV